MGKIENHFKNYNIFVSNKIKEYNQFKNPKISIIIPIYNRKSFLIRFLRNIQFQHFQKLEIILVDDCSIDNRIIIIKQKKRTGTFFTRNIGVLYAKSKYIFIPDPDDIFNKNILSICYKYSEKFNYDIIRFSVYQGNGIINDHVYNVNELLNIKIIQPKLLTSLFYVNNELGKNDFNIYNKMIKKEIYIKSLNSLNRFYLKIYMTYFEDQLMNLILYRTAKSIYFLNKIGYYYIRNSMSITEQDFKLNKLKTIFKFLYLKFIFEYSKNNKYEKDMVNHQIILILRNSILYFSDDNYNFFLKTINIFLQSKFITNSNKYALMYIKKNLLNKNKKISNIII